MKWRPEYNTLATYNAEVARGIKHTDKWKRKMKLLQRQYNKEWNTKRKGGD